MPDVVDFSKAVERRLTVDNDPESHVERDPSTFHPSQIAGCRRQCVLSKFGLKDHDTETLGTFKVGTMLHEWLEDTVEGHHLESEIPVEHYANGVTFVGRADAYDATESVVYDFKSRASWYRFNPPTDRHVDQLTVYMAALGADHGQVVYISKKNLEIKTWPEDGVFDFDPDRFEEIVGKALSIKEALSDEGLPETVEDVPFDPCGCWICDQEGADE